MCKTVVYLIIINCVSFFEEKIAKQKYRGNCQDRFTLYEEAIKLERVVSNTCCVVPPEVLCSSSGGA